MSGGALEFGELCGGGVVFGLQAVCVSITVSPTTEMTIHLCIMEPVDWSQDLSKHYASSQHKLSGAKTRMGQSVVLIVLTSSAEPVDETVDEEKGYHFGSPKC